MANMQNVLLLLVIAGIAVSVYTIYYHNELEAGSQGWCDITEELSCDVVLLSEYAEIAGVPLGYFGTMWFVVALLLLYLGMKRPKALGGNSLFYLFVWSVIGIGFIGYLVYVETFLVEAYCLICTIAHVIGVGILIASYLSLKKPIKYYIERIFYE